MKTTSRVARWSGGQLPTILACLALLLALGTTATEAAKVITGRDIRDNSITGQAVREASLRGLMTPGSVKAVTAVESAPIDDFASSSPVGIVNTDVRTPRHGVLLLNATITGTDGGAPDAGRLVHQLVVDDEPVDATDFTHGIGSSSANDVGTGGPSRLVHVPKGSHTIELQVAELGTGSDIFRQEITAVFLPGLRVSSEANR